MDDARFKQYTRTSIAEIRTIDPTDTRTALLASGCSISQADLENGSPKQGDMIARNPVNHDDKWLIAAAYFANNFVLKV